MTTLALEWVRTSDPVIRSPARYRWTTAPAIVRYHSIIVSYHNIRATLDRQPDIAVYGGGGGCMELSGIA